MRFITEEELRQRFRENPFSSFQPEHGTRLTPGAKQFLNDRKIVFSDEYDRQKLPQLSGKASAQEEIQKKDYEEESWKKRFKLIQAYFLQAGVQMMDLNILDAQELFRMERMIADMVKGEAGYRQRMEKSLAACVCTGMDESSLTHYQEDCFEITDFHAQSPNGKIIVILHVLRCQLRESFHDCPENYQKEWNYIINRISQMICHVFGGEKCQKK